MNDSKNNKNNKNNIINLNSAFSIKKYNANEESKYNLNFYLGRVMHFFEITKIK